MSAPVGTAIVSDQPRFEWRALAGGGSYSVAVFDEQSTEVARSPLLDQTNWTPTLPLPRDRTYQWQVTANRGGESIVAPSAPAPPAKFHVVALHDAETLESLEREYPQSHLLLGVLYLDAGVRDDATRHLRLVNLDVARQLLQRLESLSGQH